MHLRLFANAASEANRQIEPIGLGPSQRKRNSWSCWASTALVSVIENPDFSWAAVQALSPKCRRVAPTPGVWGRRTNPSR